MGAASSAAIAAPVSPDVRRAILLGAGALTVSAALATALLPYLVVNQPLLLLALNSDARNLVLTAHRIDMLVVLALAVPRRALGMLVTYGMALLYGRRVLAWSEKRFPRAVRLFARFEHVYLRFRAPLLVVWPMYTTSALAGATRARLEQFLPWMIVGQIVHGTVVYYLGDAFAESIAAFVAFLSRHLWESTALCMALVAVQQLVSFLRRRPDQSAVP